MGRGEDLSLHTWATAAEAAPTGSGASMGTAPGEQVCAGTPCTCHQNSIDALHSHQ